ncbi:unnamed protein product, partial [Effrenium voratum]
VGCGLTVPTVRRELEKILQKFPGGRLIRVNPENPGLAKELVSRGVSVPLPGGAAIEKLNQQVAQTEETMQATYILWGTDSGCEIKAPFGTTLGRLLRLAQCQGGMTVDFKQGVVAEVRQAMGAKTEVLTTERSVSIDMYQEIKLGEGSETQVTAIMKVAATFSGGTSYGGFNLNAPLLKRVQQVSALLDDVNERFSKPERAKPRGMAWSYRAEQWVLPWPPPFVQDGDTLSSISGFSSVAVAQFRTLETAPDVSFQAPKEEERAVIYASQAKAEPSARVSSSSISQRISLARRYFELRLASVPFMRWRAKALSQRPKRHCERRQRLSLALRLWRLRGRRRRLGRRLWLPQLLAAVAGSALRAGFRQLQQPLLHLRLDLVRARLLQIIHGRTQLSLAVSWWKQVQLRSAFAGWGFACRRLRSAPEVSIPSLSDADASPFMLEDEALARPRLPPPPELAPPARRRPESSLAKQAKSEKPPLNVFLRVQQEGFSRWWRATSMDLSGEELLARQRRGALLVLLQSRLRNSMAMQHYVASLLHKALEAFCSQDVEVSVRRHRARGRQVERPGLRGMSAGEVMRKGWQRWRYAVAAGHQVLAPNPGRPPNVTLALCRIAGEIQACRKAGVTEGARRKRRMALPAPPPESSRPPEAETTEPPHLALLQKALAGFACMAHAGSMDAPALLWREGAALPPAPEVLSLSASCGGSAEDPGLRDSSSRSPRSPRSPRSTYALRAATASVQRADAWSQLLQEAASRPPPSLPAPLPPAPVSPWEDYEARLTRCAAEPGAGPAEAENERPASGQRAASERQLACFATMPMSEIAYQKAVESCEDRRSLLKETRHIQFEVLPKFGIEASEKGTSIMAAWIGAAQGGIKEVEAKVAASMHLSRVAYIAKLPLVKNKATPEPEAPVPSPVALAPTVAPWPHAKVAQAARETTVTTPPVSQKPSPQAPSVKPEVMAEPEKPKKPKEKPKAAPKPKEEKPAVALKVTVTRFSTWEDDEPQRLRLDLMSNTKVAELRARIAEVCALDETETRKMKLIKRKKAGFMTAQESENVSSEVFVHHVDKWISA